MAEEDIKLHLNTIKEMILDEDKLITNAVLSKELCVHVNVGKFLLNAVVEDIKEKQPQINLNINYIISGLYENNQARTTVCSEAGIRAIKETLKLVFYQHIYSVKKGLPEVDTVALKNYNKFEDFPLCIGLIKNDNCNKRTSKEIRNLKTNSQDIAVTCLPQKSKSAITQNKSKDESKLLMKTDTVSQISKVKSEPCIKKEQLSPVKNSLNKQNPQTKLETKNKAPKGIAGFFNKQNGEKKPTEKVKDKTETIVIKTEKPLETKENESKKAHEKMDVDEDAPTHTQLSKSNVTSEKHKNVAVTKKNNNSNKHGNESKNKNKSLDQIKKNAKVDKKRKRVLLVSDSESDNDKDPFADDETPADIDIDEPEDEIPATPTANIVKITLGINNPKKRRKIVDKTYTDDEGYILTKKVEVYESCSDDEGEIDKKENVKNSNHVKASPIQNKNTEISPKNKKVAKKKKISPPQKGKQATMMNFFKKA